MAHICGTHQYYYVPCLLSKIACCQLQQDPGASTLLSTFACCVFASPMPFPLGASRTQLFVELSKLLFFLGSLEALTLQEGACPKDGDRGIENAECEGAQRTAVGALSHVLRCSVDCADSLTCKKFALQLCSVMATGCLRVLLLPHRDAHGSFRAELAQAIANLLSVYLLELNDPSVTQSMDAHVAVLAPTLVRHAHLGRFYHAAFPHTFAVLSVYHCMPLYAVRAVLHR